MEKKNNLNVPVLDPLLTDNTVMNESYLQKRKYTFTNIETSKFIVGIENTNTEVINSIPN